MKYAVIALKDVLNKAEEIAKRYDAPLIVFEGGEKNKTREKKAELEDALFKKGVSRNHTLIVIGGGVTLDLGGFIAATFCRGIPWISYPTSLLAMVDASIGGKTGVNTPYGKNLIGAFHPAQEVIIELEFLKSLPESEIKNGLSEMIKHGLIRSRAHFDYIAKHFDSLLKIGPEMEQAIHDSIAIKKAIVKEDPFEKGLSRHLLNFGHTVGHAIEADQKFKIPHGQAVGLGMLVELALFGGNKEAEALIEKLGLPKLKLDPTSLWDFMKADKKSLDSKPFVVKLEEIGRAKAELVPFEYERFEKAL
ncbi:MAG: 3-dehydroquinate synthase family protein, partial [Parachlamydiaceae bacterium]